MAAATPRKQTLARCAHIAESCLNFRVRVLSRRLGALYDDALRPTGLRATQFNVLVALALHGEATVKRLAVTLGMDRTTLTRNLAPLEREDLVRSRPGSDGRERVLVLTPAGHARLGSAIPLWHAAQARVVEKLGRSRARRFAGALRQAAMLLGKR